MIWTLGSQSKWMKAWKGKQAKILSIQTYIPQVWKNAKKNEPNNCTLHSSESMFKSQDSFLICFFSIP
jgi:hypothetical protein